MTVASPPHLAFLCPRCRGPVADAPDAYRCEPCGASYPIVAGIPDFRLAPDPWIGLEDDRAKALRLEAATVGRGLEDTVRAYWAMTLTTPAPLAARFIAHVVGAEQRTREWLASFGSEDDAAPDGPWLDLGCGTGDLAAAAPERTVVGIDIALRWLVVARKRPGWDAATRPLVCCCAEALPFPDRSFARVYGLGLLEHCTDPDPIATEGRRVLKAGGVMRLRTTNRYSALPEPHVGVWGVGLVPRRWADAYVRLRSGQRYLHHRPLSPRELAHAFRRARFARVAVGPARLLPSERDRLGALGAVAAPPYAVLRSIPVARAALSWIAPLLEARGVTP
ncbi:MAG: methyltransferase domain-containing protein [Gemmatimonadetes bacterium]|nr:methyltransferase domain-containing protein [Gemmatimonadota bacterium]